MKNQVLAVVVAATLGGFAATERSIAAAQPAASATSALIYHLPVCNPMLPPGTFCIDDPYVKVPRPPHIPQALWEQILAL